MEAANVENTKICTGCKKEMLATKEFFYSKKGGKYGLRPKCKQCMKAIAEKWNQENYEKCKESHAKWRKNNPEKIKERGEKWRKNNPEKYKKNQRKYYKENSEKLKEYMKEYNKKYYKYNLKQLQYKRLSGGDRKIDFFEKE